MTAISVDATCVKVMWDQPPLETVNGRLVGYRVRYSNGDFADVHDSDGGMREVNEELVLTELSILFGIQFSVMLHLSST